MNRWLIVLIVVGLFLVFKYADRSPFAVPDPVEIPKEAIVYPEHTDNEGVAIGSPTNTMPFAASSSIIMGQEREP